MDREADICEVLEGLPSEPIDVVIRSKEKRRILDGNGERTKLHEILKKQQSMGQMEIILPKKKGRVDKRATLEVKSGQVQILPSQFNPSNEPLSMSYVEVKQIAKRATKDQTTPPIHWILWTNKKIDSLEQAQQIIGIYAKRWDIEIFFKSNKNRWLRPIKLSTWLWITN